MELFNKLLEGLQNSPLWKVLQPLVLGALAVYGASILTYQYLSAQYGFTPSPRLFVSSYLFARLVIVIAGLVVLMLLFKVQLRGKKSDTPAASRRRARRRLLAFRVMCVFVVATAALGGMVHYSPRQVPPITIKLMSQPVGFRPEAFAYLVFELNRIQDSWHFDLDLEPYNTLQAKSTELAGCEHSDIPDLCFAQVVARNGPLIGITSRPLGGVAYFGTHINNVSVITTADKEFEPVSIYDYLIHSVITQGIVIHLDTVGGGLPSNFLLQSDVSHGGVFQFVPNKNTLKSTILAAHLNQNEQELLFNRFGVEYLSACSKLVSLEWLHSQRVEENLKAYFDPEAKPAAATPPADARPK